MAFNVVDESGKNHDRKDLERGRSQREDALRKT